MAFFLRPNRVQLSIKGVPKIVPKKGTPQDANKTLFPGWEAPGDEASCAHFQQQKQQFGQQQQQLQQQLQKQLLELMFCLKLLFDSVFEMIVRSRFQELFELLHLLEQHPRACDLTRPGQRPGEFICGFPIGSYWALLAPIGPWGARAPTGAAHSSAWPPRPPWNLPATCLNGGVYFVPAKGNM